MQNFSPLHSEDGTIRWFRLADGEELLALFVHAKDRRYVAWTPKGYYAASPGAGNLIGWHVYRGWDRAPDFFSAARFYEHFDRPDIVKRVLDDLDEDAAVAEANRLPPQSGPERSRSDCLRRLPPWHPDKHLVGEVVRPQTDASSALSLKIKSQRESLKSTFSCGYDSGRRFDQPGTYHARPPGELEPAPFVGLSAARSVSGYWRCASSKSTSRPQCHGVLLSAPKNANQLGQGRDCLVRSEKTALRTRSRLGDPLDRALGLPASTMPPIRWRSHKAAQCRAPLRWRRGSWLKSGAFTARPAETCHGCGCAGGPIGPIAGPAKSDRLKRCYAYPLPSVPIGIIENIKRGREAGVSAWFRAVGVYRFQRGQ